MTIQTPTAITKRVQLTGLALFKSQFSGEIITEESLLYDEARKVHDPTVDRRPLAIARAATAQDVAVAVRFARAHGFSLAVRSGGHSIPHLSMIDGAIIVDLSAMKGVTIDPEQKVAWVQPGATSGDLAGPAHAYGLALSTGDTSSVGFGGLATGGGIGYMVRKYGMTIDNIISAQVVTADGEIVTASAEENADLFWAIRGGGGNFGIVTEFKVRLAPVGQVLGGALVLPGTREVIRGYLDYVVDAPEDLTTIANLMFAPPAPFIPENRVGELALMILVTWTGRLEEGERALAPLRALAAPIADTVAPIPYPAMYIYMEPAAAPHAAVVRSMFSNEVSGESVDAIIAAMGEATSPMNIVQLRGLGGAMARVGNGETAFAHRDKRYLTAVLALWLDPAEDRVPHEQWAESLWGKVRADADGVYVNFLENEGEVRIREAYGEENFSRLAQVKAKYDPENVFRFNQNIQPQA
jgi:FAD binding domain-containing protein/berberine-like enzyme